MYVIFFIFFIKKNIVINLKQYTASIYLSTNNEIIRRKKVHISIIVS